MHARQYHFKPSRRFRKTDLVRGGGISWDASRFSGCLSFFFHKPRISWQEMIFGQGIVRTWISSQLCVFSLTELLAVCVSVAAVAGHTEDNGGCWAEDPDTTAQSGYAGQSHGGGGHFGWPCKCTFSPFFSLSNTWGGLFRLQLDFRMQISQKARKNGLEVHFEWFLTS